MPSRSSTNTAGAGRIQPPSPLNLARSLPIASSSSREWPSTSYLSPYAPITSPPSSDRTGNSRLCLSDIVSDLSGVWGDTATSRSPHFETSAAPNPNMRHLGLHEDHHTHQ